MSEDFWDVAAPLMAEGVIAEGTIMGGACVRASGEFVAMPHHKGPGIIVKLPKGKVAELIEAGEGQPFAPAGKVFSEWVLVGSFDEDRRNELIRDSVTFVSGG